MEVAIGSCVTAKTLPATASALVVILLTPTTSNLSSPGFGKSSTTPSIRCAKRQISVHCSNYLS